MIQRHALRTKFLLGLAIAGLVVAGAPVAAQAAEMPEIAIKVSARDLDLRTEAGAATLRHRVLAASYKMCSQPGVSGAFGTDAFSQCVRDGVRGATPQMLALVNAARAQDRFVASSGTR